MNAYDLNIAAGLGPTIVLEYDISVGAAEQPVDIYRIDYLNAFKSCIINDGSNTAADKLLHSFPLLCRFRSTTDGFFRTVNSDIEWIKTDFATGSGGVPLNEATVYLERVVAAEAWPVVCYGPGRNDSLIFKGWSYAASPPATGVLRISICSANFGNVRGGSLNTGALSIFKSILGP